MRARLLIVLVAGCAIDKDEVGPTVHVRLEAAFGSATDQSTSPSFTLFDDDAYSIDVEIDTSSGTSMQKTDTAHTDHYAVTAFTLTTTVPGVDIPDAEFTKMDFFDDPQFTRDAPIVIPGSAKGSAMQVHLVAEDSRGLSSNVIDFSIALE